MGTPLKDWDISIYRGILTGFNEAFIISGEKRQEILDKCQTEDERKRTKDILRPILRGRDIKRYGYEFANLYLIATFPSKKYNIDEYPAVKNHLLSFGYERLKQTGEAGARKKTNNKWFETQDSIGYWEDFFKPKIIYQELTQGSNFTLDKKGDFFVSNTGYLITGRYLEYLIAILNSNFVEYVFRQFYSVSLGEKGLRWLAQCVENLPITKPSNETEQQIIKLLENQQYKEIDRLIYKLYNLSNDEIKFIQSQ